MRRLQRQLTVRRRVVLGKWYLCIRDHLRRIKHPQPESRRHQALDGRIDLSFVDQTVFDGLD